MSKELSEEAEDREAVDRCLFLFFGLPSRIAAVVNGLTLASFSCGVKERLNLFCDGAGDSKFWLDVENTGSELDFCSFLNLDTGLVPHVASKVNFLRILPGVKLNEYINSK